MADKISIIIPTCNRASLLDRCLASLAGQTVPPEEVVVVDNGSSDQTRIVVNSYSTLPVRYCFMPERNRQAARNKAVELAAGDILVMMDDDCYVNPSFVEGVARMFEEHREADALAYSIRYPNGSNLLNKVWVLVGDDYIKRNHGAYGGTQFAYLRRLYTTNSALRKRALSHFPEVFDSHFAYSEDKELFVRLERRGCRVLYVPGLFIWHDCSFPSFFSFLMKYYHYGYFDVMVENKHGTFERKPAWKDVVSFIKRVWGSRDSGAIDRTLIISIYFLRSFFYVAGCFWGRRLIKRGRVGI